MRLLRAHSSHQLPLTMPPHRSKRGAWRYGLSFAYTSAYSACPSAPSSFRRSGNGLEQSVRPPIQAKPSLLLDNKAEQGGSGRRLSAALLNFPHDDSIFPTGSERRHQFPARLSSNVRLKKMAGTFISFWNAAYVDSPVMMNGHQKDAFWVLLNFIEKDTTTHSVFSKDDGCRSLISGAKSTQTLDFSKLSDDATRYFRSVLADWSDSSHPYWSRPIPWSELGGFGISFPQVPATVEAEKVAVAARGLGAMVSQNLVCADYN